MKYFVNILLFFYFLNPLIGQEFKVEKLSSEINSGYDEITPIVSRDGKTLYFSRVAYPEFERTLFLDKEDLSSKLSPEKYTEELGKIFGEIGNAPVSDPEKSAFNQDVWLAKTDDNETWTIQHPGFPLNNALPNSLVAITPDPSAFYIINQFDKDGGMKKGFSLIRLMQDGNWTFPEPIEIEDYYTITSDVSLTMSFDGQTLILSAERYDSEEMDLYVCFKRGENNWSQPQHLGSMINSDKRETTPFLSEDNTTLFFSSNRWGSSGNDIYMSRRLDDTWKNWTTPVLLSAPINSPSDESQPYFNMTTGCLYFASRRDGSSDIYKVKIAPPQPTEIVIKGRILNAQTGELIKKANVHYGAENSAKNITVTDDGYYTLRIPKGVRFELTPEKTGYTGKADELFFKRDYYYFQDYYVLDLVLEPLEVNALIQLKPIYFQQSKATILEKSHPELNRLFSLLDENPNLCIQIEGHTDSNGKPQDLIRLSEERAEALKSYLLDKGISRFRIKTMGYGDKFPLNDNSTVELREQNRRVEIRITKT